MNLNRFTKFSDCRFSSWVTPQGYDTRINIFNKIAKGKVPFITQNENIVTWYTCGPTVYDSSHIGHASCYVKLDIIQRILKNYFKMNLVTVMNITDIDDKIIAKSNEMKLPYQDLTKLYEKEFWHDLQTLNVNKPNVILRVSENIDSIKAFIQYLLDNQSAYVAENNSVYFKVNKNNYWKLQKPPESELSSSNVIDEKESVMDFALWKGRKENEPYWDSSWGPGRPGWHIECSALASKIFGSTIDVHAGGIDLRFPHHENEEAQSCAYYGKTQWVNYWIHSGHLHLKNDVKMSKSLKNTISISKMLETTSSDTFRLACLMSRYRHRMEFSEEFMKMAAKTLKNYKNFIVNCDDHISGTGKASTNSDSLKELLFSSQKRLDKVLRDDFNTPEVVNLLNEIVSVTNSVVRSTSTVSDSDVLTVSAISNFFKNTLTLLGVDMFAERSDVNDQLDIDLMNILNDFRYNVRQLGITSKNSDILQLCDNVRNSLNKCGINIRDTKETSTWSR